MVRWLISVVLVLVTGVVGLSGVFADAAPGESMLGRAMFVGGAYLLGCGAIGAMLDRYWWLAGLASWGPVLVGVGSAMALARATEYGPAVPLLVLNVVLFPALSLACGLAGRWGWRKFRASASSAGAGGPR
ncbi:MAG TPA: hypothetical protein VF139_18810 [Candidatus Polarisedimenticolaceae bacterium]